MSAGNLNKIFRGPSSKTSILCVFLFYFGLCYAVAFDFHKDILSFSLFVAKCDMYAPFTFSHILDNP